MDRRSRRGSKLFAIVSACALIVTHAHAGAGVTYQINEEILNAGGDPATGVDVQSANYTVSLDALGDLVDHVRMAGVSYQQESSLVAAFFPSDEVGALRLINASSLRWNASRAAGSYNIYRGALNTLPALGYGSCTFSAVIGSSASDPQQPPVGEGFFYLVTVRNRLREDGTKGYRSNGSERLGSTCP